MRDPNDARLVIAGTEVTGWTALTLDMAIDHLADGLAITAPWDPESSPLRNLIRPYGYEKVQLYIGDDLLLTGRIDKITPSLSEGDRSITLEARSLTGILADCSITGDLEFSGLTLAAIARKVCSPLGVQVRADYDTAVIQEARAEYGQKAGDFLNSLAAPRNFLLNSSYDGKLVLTDARSLVVKAPCARLVEGTPEPGQLPILSITAPYDSTGLFSLYRIVSQSSGHEDITGEVTDDAVPLFRPFLTTSGDTDTDPAETAARLQVVALSKAVRVSPSVSGWRRPDGKRWAERQTVTLRAPSAMLYREAPWLISGVTMQLDASNGRTTAFELSIPDMYTSKLKKSKKRKTKSSVDALSAKDDYDWDSLLNF